MAATSGKNASSCQQLQWFSVAVEHPAYLAQLAVCGVGLLLNALTLAVFMTGKEFKGAPFVFMSALALSDMCNLLLRAPECFVMAYRQWPPHPQPQLLKDTKLLLYYLLVNVLNPLGNVTENLSVWLTVCLALERYVAMQHVSVARTKCTSANAGAVTAGSALAAACTNAFSFFGVRAAYRTEAGVRFVQARASAFYQTAWYDGLAWLRACVAQFLPLIFLAVANLGLLAALRRQGRKLRAQRSAETPQRRGSRRQLAQRRLTLMLVIVICLVLFGQVPQAFSFHSLFSMLFAGCAACRALDRCLFYRQYKLAASCPNLLFYSCNFFVYFGLNRHFRHRLLRLLTCGRRPLPPADLQLRQQHQQPATPLLQQHAAQELQH